jgi:broad specificity phosphatase PhoE
VRGLGYSDYHTQHTLTPTLLSLRLHLLRHGQTALSRENVFCGRGLDPELTVDGQAMAQAFADCYSAFKWDAIYASPLKRATATAAPLAASLGIEVQVRAGFAEIDYGEWDGLSAEVVAERWRDDYIRWVADPAWNAPVGGETAIALEQRITDAVEEIVEAHPDGEVLIVSHKASIRVLLCALLGVDVGRFRYRFGCPVGSVSVVSFGAHGPLAESVADRSHLSAAMRSLPGT